MSAVDLELRSRIAAFYDDYHRYRGRQPDRWMARHYWPTLSGRTLEIGAGTLAPPGHADYWSIDLSLEAAHRSVASGRVAMVADGSRAPFANRSFDTVACYDVLEHVLKPDQFIAEMCRVARRRVVIAGPNYVALHPGGMSRYLPLRLLDYICGPGRDCARLSDPYLRFDAGWVPDRDAVAAPNAGWVAGQITLQGYRIRTLRTWERGYGYLNALPALRCLGPFMLIIGDR